MVFTNIDDESAWRARNIVTYVLLKKHAAGAQLSSITRCTGKRGGDLLRGSLDSRLMSSNRMMAGSPGGSEYEPERVVRTRLRWGPGDRKYELSWLKPALQGVEECLDPMILAHDDILEGGN